MSVISLLWQISFLQRLISRVCSETTSLVRDSIFFGSRGEDLLGLAVLTEQVAGGIVVPGSGRLIACLGVDDLVIVDMPDTLLVTTRARSQEVKRLVKKCRDAGWKQLL